MKSILTVIFILISQLLYAGCGPYEIVDVYPEVGSIEVPINLTSIKFIPDNLLSCSTAAKFRDGYLRIFESTTNQLVDSIDVNDYYPYGYEAPFGEELIFPLNTTLQYCTNYYVTMDIGTVYNPCCSSGGDFGMYGQIDPNTGDGYFWGEWVTTPQPHWEGFTWEFTTITPEIQLDVTDASCYNSCDGSIEIYSPLTNQGQIYNNHCPNTYFFDLSAITYGCIDNFEVTIDSPDSIVIYETVTNSSINLSVNGGIPPYQFNWTGPNGFISNQPYNINNLQGGIYTYTITDNNGCQSSNEISISIMSIEDITHIKNSEHILFPNPSKIQINIKPNTNYRIIDISGRTISKNFTENGTINVSHLNGVYYLFDNNQIHKFIVE